MDVAGYLAGTEEFKKTVDPLIKGKNIKENVYRFLAYDFERDVALKVYAKTREKMEKEVETEMKKEEKNKAKNNPNSKSKGNAKNRK